jgi:hypothetical protein
MPDRDDEAIAKQEADQTYNSISNLDNIGDTMFVAVTFFLAALATWTPFALQRLSGVQEGKNIVIILTIICVLSIGSSVFFLAIALAPRSFYGHSTGDQLLSHPWLLWRNNDAGNVQGFLEQRQTIEDEEDLRSEYEKWLRQYDADVNITSKESFEYSRLLDYKIVARIKARYTAFGVSLFRIATIIFVIIVIVTLIVPLIF